MSKNKFSKRSVGRCDVEALLEGGGVSKHMPLSQALHDFLTKLKWFTTGTVRELQQVYIDSSWFSKRSLSLTIGTLDGLGIL